MSEKQRVYHCPICGKTYVNLKDMYDCALNCEKKEQEAEKKKAGKDALRGATERTIDKHFKTLQKLISEYNKNYSPYSYNLILTHQGGDSLAEKSESILSEDDIKKLEKLEKELPPLNYKYKRVEPNKKTKPFNDSWIDGLAAAIGCLDDWNTDDLPWD